MLVLEQLMDKFAQFTFSNKPLLLILLAIVVTNVSFLKEIRKFSIYLLNHFTVTARGANYFRSAIGPSPMRDRPRPPHRGLRRLLFTNGG